MKKYINRCGILVGVIFLTGLAMVCRGGEMANGLGGGKGGKLYLVIDGGELCDFSPYLAEGDWKPRWGESVPNVSGPPWPYVIPYEGGKLEGTFQGEGKDGSVHAAWAFSSPKGCAFKALAIAAQFKISALAGGSWEVDGHRGTFSESLGEPILFAGQSKSLNLTLPDKRVLKFSFPQPMTITLQDNRTWGTPYFVLRVGRGGGEIKAGEQYSVAMDVTLSGGLRYSSKLEDILKPVILKADEQWVPLQPELDISPGSALDFSSAGFVDGPCGSKGRVIITPEGHFAYADEPSKTKRFYGVNFCFSGQFLPKEQVDALLDRLVRLGYNTLRIHHYESNLTKPEWKPGFDWDPARVDQLDYLMAGCAKRGIWITTDLYVSRPVAGSQIGRKEEMVDKDIFKLLVLVDDAAFKDWAAFTRKFLDRVNPYTGKRVADDPTLAWISLINEGPASNYWHEVRELPQWTAAWNRWLAARYATREKLAEALGDLAAGEDPASNSVALPKQLMVDSPRSLVCQVFVAETQKNAYGRMRDFVRKEVGCRALLTDMNNAGTAVVPLQAAREAYDYVDEHFYVDHPQFIEKAWTLPSACPNSNPIRNGAEGGLGSAVIRLYGKPFTISEFNYSAPGRFRGMGGILTGAMASLQNWDALWRFAYSHRDVQSFQPTSMDYFNLACDPLNQAADRLAVLLYLRGDVAVAPSRLGLVIPEDALTRPSSAYSLNGLRGAVWSTRVGDSIVAEGGKMPADIIPVTLEQAGDRKAVEEVLGRNKLPVVEQTGVPIRSETGQILIKPDQGTFTVDTPKSAGGYAESGGSFEASSAGVKVDRITTDATVFVSSVDALPISKSHRLLVTHLTDLQNTGIRYRDASMKVLQAWGTLPYLVRTGEATVHIRLSDPKDYSVWALSVGGRRLEKVESQVVDGQLVFTARVRSPEGARMLYEVVR